MSISPSTSAPAVAGVKRSSPSADDNQSSDSPLKRARVDGSREDTASGPHQPLTASFQDSKALVPLLHAAVNDALAFVQSLSADQILALEHPRPQPPRWACFCSVLSKIESYLSPDSFAQWATDEDWHTLRQAWLLSTLQAFLSHDFDSLVALKTGLDFLLVGDNASHGADWSGAFLDLMDDCLDDEDGLATGHRLREIVGMLGTHGLIPVANFEQTSNGNQTARSPPSVHGSPLANDTTQEVSQQPAQLQSGAGAALNGLGASADNEVFVEDEFDFMAIARRAAQSALNPHPDEPAAESTVPAPSQSGRPAQSANPATQSMTKELPTRTPATPPQSTSISTDDRSGNSNATLIAQYEEARAFAAQRSQQKRLAVSNPNSARRPWTEEEENTLMRGLDQLHGPFWAQILELYGEYGTHSTILRGRTQVQLKDKARNLKLYFLKNDLPVPDSLRHVTGVLKPKTPGNQDAGKTSSEERTG